MQQQTQGMKNQMQHLKSVNYGGHELFDLREVLSCNVNVLDQYMASRQFVQDEVLLDILDRQYNFMLSQYNLTVESYSSGQEPSQETATYMIKDMTQPVYGLNQAQPQKPNQSLADMNDAGISGHMLGLIKGHASLLTKSALEVTNPVVRRVVASQIQHFVEMAYEIFMYQNKKGYYQIPQLNASDMQVMLNSFAQATGAPQMPTNNKAATTIH